MNRKETMLSAEYAPVSLIPDRNLLDAICGRDDVEARRAFASLEKTARSVVDTYLRTACHLVNPEDRSDIAQEVLVRLWNTRHSFQNQGVASWRAWLKRTAYRCFVDWLRAGSRLPLVAEWDEDQVPQEERPLAEAVLILAEAQQLYFLADCLFLGLDPEVRPEEHDRRLLAAQLFYLDKEPWENVLHLLGPEPPGNPALDRARLDEWLADAALLRHLAFRTLFMENTQLAEHLLNAPDLPSPKWSEAERIAIVLRYRNGLLEDQVAERQDCALNKEEISALCERCEALFPFENYIKAFLTSLNSAVRQAVRQDFAEPGLWQRLAFEYRYREFLAHKDIQARTQPPARAIGGDVTEGMLNVWLSNGRLLRRLGKFASEHFH